MLKTRVDKAGLSFLGSVCLWIWPCSLANLGIPVGSSEPPAPKHAFTQAPVPERSVSCKTRG